MNDNSGTTSFVLDIPKKIPILSSVDLFGMGGSDGEIAKNTVSPQENHSVTFPT